VRQHVHASIARMLVASLNVSSVDVFASLVLVDARSAALGHEDMPTWLAANVNPNADEIGEAFAELRPRALTIVLNGSGTEASVNPRCLLDGYLKARTVRPMSQWRTLSRCLPLISAAEAIDGRAYTQIVRSRPDLFWPVPHPPLTALRPDACYTDSRHPQVDWHAVFPRHVAPTFFGLYRRYEACDSANASDAKWRWVFHVNDNEHMTERVLREPGCPLRQRHLPMLLVRASREQPAARRIEMCHDSYALATFNMSCTLLNELAYPELPMAAHAVDASLQ